MSKIPIKLNKDIKKYVNLLLDDDWELIRHTKHLVFKKDTKTLVVSKTPSDYRCLKNILSNTNQKIQ